MISKVTDNHLTVCGKQDVTTLCGCPLFITSKNYHTDISYHPLHNHSLGCNPKKQCYYVGNAKNSSGVTDIHNPRSNNNNVFSDITNIVLITMQCDRCLINIVHA